MSFDWFRNSDRYWNAIQTPNGLPLYDWKYKSPVLRVLLEDGAEIVWENYFNLRNINENNYVDTWITSNLINDVFWYRIGNQYSVITGQCALNTVPVWSGLHAPATISSITNCFGDKNVVGMSVGVGSQWPYQYHGFVDNVKIGFNNTTTVNANFDRVSTVPEPTTYVLLTVGLIVIYLVKYPKLKT